MSRKFIVWFGSFVVWQELCWAAAWIPPPSIRLSSPDRYHTTTAPKTITTTKTTISPTTTRRYQHQPLPHSDDNNKDETNGIRFGILGCGTIGSAIARGIITQTRIPIQSIMVTKRSESKSKELQQEFPSIVTCHESPQTVLDRSDWIFLTVLPQQATNLLQSLTWDPSRHYLISLVSTATMETLISDSQLPPSQVSKCICLPSIARHQGTSLLYTSTQDSILFNLLTAMGGYVLCSSEDQLSIGMISTVFMGPFYGTMRHQRNWLMSRGGWSSSDATRLVLSQYYGMIQDALQRQMSIDTVLDDLLAEQTPGGLNEQAYSILSSQGVWDAYDVAMDTVVARIQGSSKTVDKTTEGHETSD